MLWLFFVKLFPSIHPFVPSSIHGWHHTGEKNPGKNKYPPPPLDMCRCLGKPCPTPGGGTPKINKSQGQTFNNVGVYMPSPNFYHGQLYVAISQVTSSANIKSFTGQGPDEYMRNVVYREVLEM
jgi:hypothetical protein